MQNLIKIEATLTDTFGGETNYAWVKRETITVPEDASNRVILKHVRNAFGITGKLRKYYDLNDELSYNLDGACIRLFINFL